MKIPQYLIDKYNTPVPRYTSYPPANFFIDTFTPNDYVDWLQQSNNEATQNISLYIHIPFCPKICYYCGCNTHLTKDENKMREYVEAVKKEILMVKKHLDSKRKVSQIHWGGGTPNSLPVALVSEIMELIHANFQFTDKPENAMECHPALLTKNYIEKLVSLGFNRFSLGIQDFKQDVLDGVNREASKIIVEELVAIIRSHKNTSVNLDFIYGLPFQDKKSFAETIERAIRISPNRLVTFSYAHVPWVKKAQKILEKHGLPSAEKKMEMFETSYQLLLQNGYKAIGLDHFAKPDDELYQALKSHTLHRNFQGYCTRETTGQVYAFGATGISQMDSAYAQNAKDTETYINSINKGEFTIEKGYLLNPSEKIIRYVIEQLMCNYYLSWKDAEESLQTSVDKIKNTVVYDEKILETFASEGLLDYNDETITVNEKGKFFIRNIASGFDPAIKNSGKKFSKAL